MGKIIPTLTIAATAVAGLVLISFLLSWPVWILWNACFVGAIAGVNEITWPQAWGIGILFGMLFKDSSSKS